MMPNLPDEFLITPDDPGYEKTRRIWNGMIDRRPALIARCASAANVSATIRFAREAGLPVSIRCGGHNVAGSSVADGAVMIDLSPMRGVTVDASSLTAEADGGCLLHDVDVATTAYGLACPAGVYSLTGLAGLALGGGYGWRCRKLGLTCDHIIGAEIVLADGSVLDVSQQQHPELLWALRGGGGNFGVVTRFTLSLNRVGPFLVRTAVYPGDAAAEALRAYAAFTPALSDDFHLLGGLRHAKPGDPIPPDLQDRPVVDFIAVCSADDAASVDQSGVLFAALPACGQVQRTVSYLELQALADGSAPTGRRYYTKSGYLSEMCDEAVELLVDGVAKNPSRTGSIDIEYLRGTMARTTAAESSFPQRDAPFMVSVYGSWDDPGLDHDGISWARETFGSVRAWEHPGRYSNYVSETESAAEIPEMYSTEVYARLTEVKRQYDPDNVFRSARSIFADSVPSSATTTSAAP